jgi:hypothetical protein
MMIELIDDFFDEYPAPSGGSDKVDTAEADEVIDAIRGDSRRTDESTVASSAFATTARAFRPR